jgi:nitrite reductase/ring-hydroxylating ferredoxin subunit
MAARERVIGASAGLVDGGPGFRFAVGAPAGAEIAAFAIGFRGRVHACVNSRAHQDVELDWIPGAFFDAQGEHLVCATHGALYAPDSGCCVDGPCRGAQLTRMLVYERGVNGAIVVGAAPGIASMVIETEGKPHSEQDRHG